MCPRFVTVISRSEAEKIGKNESDGQDFPVTIEGKPS